MTCLYNTVLILICISVWSGLEWQLGSWKWKQEASTGIPRRCCCSGNCFPPFGLLEKRLCEVLACSTTQTQFSVWHSGSTVSHMHSDIHVNVGRHLTNTRAHTHIYCIVQSAVHAQRDACRRYMCAPIHKHTASLHTSSWHIYTLHNINTGSITPMCHRCMCLIIQLLLFFYVLKLIYFCTLLYLWKCIKPVHQLWLSSAELYFVHL